MKYFAALSLVFLLALSSVAMAEETTPSTGSVALLCKMEQHSKIMSQTISIDYDKKLANGVPATFSPTIIAWTIQKESKVQHHEVNRITGTYYYWIDDEPGPEPMPTFTCEKALPKF